MQIITNDLLSYAIFNTGKLLASIRYQDSSFAKAEILAVENYAIQQIATGTWVFQFTDNGLTKIMNTIRTQPAGVMTITTFYHRKKYRIRRSQNHKLRFSLFNHNEDELLSILPVLSWQKTPPAFTLQVNEEFEKECDAFLILQVLHCTLCSLSMMLGGSLPALVSV
jgi:hypothetical protein